MKKRLMALFICVCMLLTAPVLTGAAVAEEAPQPEQAETPAQAPAAEPAEAAAQSAAYELAEQTVTGTASDGASVSITGLLPVGAAAVIEPVVLGHDEIVAYLGEEQAAQMEQYVAYNISVMIGDAEYVLDETVSVTVTQPALEIAEDAQVTVNHVVEDAAAGTVEVKQLSAQTDAGQVSFETDGFSLYLFTVDFHYDGLTYSIDGGSSILLSELFTALNVNRDAKTAQQVTFSDETLVSVARQEDGDWLLTSLAPFQTGETLTVKFSDTDVLTIAVTDAAGVQTTNDAVKIGSSGLMTTYQMLGKLYPDIYCEYSRWGGGRSVTFYVYDGNTELGRGDTKRNTEDGVNFLFSSSKYWFELFESKNVGNAISNGDSITILQFGAYGIGEKYIKVKIHDRVTYSNANYCTVTQECALSNSMTNKGGSSNVSRKVFIYVDGVQISSASYTFPGRTDCDVGNIDVSYDSNKYEMTKSEANGSGKTVSDGNNYRVDLRSKYTVSYNANGGSGAPASQTKTNGKTLTLSSTKPTRANYTFSGWATTKARADAGTVDYVSGASYTANASVTLYAAWTPNAYTATAAMGTGISATTGTGTYGYNSSVTFTAAVQPGYTFDGWYNGSTKVSGSTSYSFNMPNSNVTYTAKATANTYTLTTSAEHATILDGFDYTYDASAKIDVTFSPDANYRISAISVDGIALSGDALASAIAAGKVQLDRTMSHSVSVTAVPDTASYTVNYYKADPAGGDAISLGSTAQTGVIGSTITVAAGTGEGQLDWHKPAAGYKSGVLQDSSTTVAADGGSAVSVLYEIDPGQTKELSYTVKYVVSGVEKDPYSVTKSVQLLQPDTLSVENIALKAYPGFKYSDNSASLVQSGSSLTGAGTIANGGVISVNYAPTVSSVTLTMHVLGQYADLTRDFTGSLSVGSYVLDGADSAAATPYSLRHGATVTVSDIRSAHTLSVTDLESASGYTLTKVTYTLPGGSATELTVTGSATDAVEIPEGATNVDLYYERALVPDSGVVDGHLGAVYALLGSAAVLCAAYVFLSGRRRREEG